MTGANRASGKDYDLEKSYRSLLENIQSERQVPCIFVSYQRRDEQYASEIAEYIMSKRLDVYFDVDDKDLKLSRQLNNPKKVTNAIKAGLNKSEYMIVIVSPSTYRSFWVPFEVGYAYEQKGDKMKLLGHKGINETTMPDYLRVKEMLQGMFSLNDFLFSIIGEYPIYESIMKGEEVRSFNDYISNPLSQYLDNE